MITSKERAYLKKLISTQNAVYQIGKDNLNENCLNGIEEALKARELIKINVLPSCDCDLADLAKELEQRLNCEIVCIIGKKIILYRFNGENKKHVLENNI